MRLKRSSRPLTLALLASLALSARAQTTLGQFEFSGYLDLYYQYDFNRPPTGANVNLRSFDVRHNSFSLALGQLNIVRRPTAQSPFGLRVELAAGRNTEIIHAAEPGGTDTYKFFHQAFVTYAVPNSGITVDFGKYASWIGYEVFPSGDNDNYSRSFVYTLGQPNYHTGLRATVPLKGGVTAAAYLVNGWNEVDDSNGGKTLGATVTAPVGKTATLTASYYGGNEGAADAGGVAFATPGQRHVNLGDLILVVNPNPKLKLALNGTYANAEGLDGNSSGKWHGIAGYARAQFSPRFAGALRLETFTDRDGLRIGTEATVRSLTATADFTLGQNGLFRLEFRYDSANEPVFTGGEEKRSTLTFAHVLRF